MPEDEPDAFNAAGSPVRVAKAPVAPPEIENRVPKYLMPQPAPRQRLPPQFNNGNGEPIIKKPKIRKSMKKSKSKRKTRKN
jgi:hypothetical protein